MRAAVQEAKVTKIRSVLVVSADDGIFVQVVVARGKYEADYDDEESPLLMKAEDEISCLDSTWIEQFLHSSTEASGGRTKQ